MICQSCREAGALLGARVSMEIVTDLHKQCPGGTWCCCQHETSMVLDMHRVNMKGTLGDLNGRAKESK